MLDAVRAERDALREELADERRSVECSLGAPATAEPPIISDQRARQDLLEAALDTLRLLVAFEATSCLDEDDKDREARYARYEEALDAARRLLGKERGQ